MAELLSAAGDLDLYFKAKTDRVISIIFATGGTGDNLSNYSAATLVVRKNESTTASLFTLTLGSGITLSAAGVCALTFTDTQLDMMNTTGVYSLTLVDVAGLIDIALVGKFITQDTA